VPLIFDCLPIPVDLSMRGFAFRSHVMDRFDTNADTNPGGTGRYSANLCREATLEQMAYQC
jgi:hypothetical protein